MVADPVSSVLKGKYDRIVARQEKKRVWMRGEKKINTDKLARDFKIAERHINGETTKEIAESMGISQSCVSTALNRDEVQDAIKLVYNKLMGTLTPAFENLKYSIDRYQTTKDRTIKEHGFKASQRVLESAGILNTTTQSVVHNTFIGQQNNVLPEMVNDLIDKYVLKDVIDVTPGQRSGIPDEQKLIEG